MSHCQNIHFLYTKHDFFRVKCDLDVFSPIDICLSFHCVLCSLQIWPTAPTWPTETHPNVPRAASPSEDTHTHTHTHTREALWQMDSCCWRVTWPYEGFKHHVWAVDEYYIKHFGKLSSYEFEVVFLSVFVAMCLSIFVRVFFCILYVTLYLHVVCECVCVRPRPPKHSHILQITGLGTRRIISLWMWPLALL